MYHFSPPFLQKVSSMNLSESKPGKWAIPMLKLALFVVFATILVKLCEILSMMPIFGQN